MSGMSVAECRSLLSECEPSELPALIAAMDRDPRSGVRSAAAVARRRLDSNLAERERVLRLLDLERSLRAQGYTLVAGVDEVGRGALAGPVTAAAAILSDDAVIEGLDDSKRLTPEQRTVLFGKIRSVTVCWRVAHVSPQEIDSIGIGHAVRRAMRLAVDALSPAPDHVIVDGLSVGIGRPETAVVGGDGLCAAVAAASILAKVTRDTLMVEYDAEFPQYGLGSNKGYGTSDHVAAITEHGLTRLHRRSFAPCGDTMRLF